MALFRNFGVNRRNRLCGIQNRLSPRNAADFLELAGNYTFLDRKLIHAINLRARIPPFFKGGRLRWFDRFSKPDCPS